MNSLELAALEVRNVRPFSVAIATGLAGYASLSTPLGTVLGQFADAPALLTCLVLLVTFSLSWTFAYLFGGFSAVVKRENAVYDRHFALPVAPWRVFLAEVAGVAVPVYLFTAGTVLAVGIQAPGLPVWVFPLALAAAAVFVVGAVTLVFVTTLYFDNPRAPTVAFFAGIGVFWVALRSGSHVPLGPVPLASLLAVVLSSVSGLAVLALMGLSGRHLHD